METLLLTRSDIEQALSPAALLDLLRRAFAAYSTQRSIDAMRIPIPLPQQHEGASGMLLAPGLVAGIPAYSVKVHAKFPGGEPAIHGVLILHDLETGAPLAILESSYLTALRTGLAGAVGADVLALPEARCVAIIGAGVQARSQLTALRMVRELTMVRVFDSSTEAALRFAVDPACAGLKVAVRDSVSSVLAGAHIAITSTWARQPFLLRGHLHPGLHITTLGADQPGKCEIAAEALTAARVVVDDRKLALEMGAVGGAGLGAVAIHAELGEVIAGLQPGRETPERVTVFGSVASRFKTWLLVGSLTTQHGRCNWDGGSIFSADGVYEIVERLPHKIHMHGNRRQVLRPPISNSRPTGAMLGIPAAHDLVSEIPLDHPAHALGDVARPRRTINFKGEYREHSV